VIFLQENEAWEVEMYKRLTFLAFAPIPAKICAIVANVTSSTSSSNSSTTTSTKGSGSATATPSGPSSTTSGSGASATASGSAAMNAASVLLMGAGVGIMGLFL
jgi:hypothetical protein